jgi:hypothetical protein
VKPDELPKAAANTTRPGVPATSPSGNN